MAQSLATLVAMTSNFALNNQLTFRDRRFIGGRFFIGLLLFYVSCSLALSLVLEFQRGYLN